MKCPYISWEEAAKRKFYISPPQQWGIKILKEGLEKEPLTYPECQV